MQNELDLLKRYRQESMALRDFERHMEQLTRPAGPRGLSAPRQHAESTNDPESASRQLEEGLERMLAHKRAGVRALEEGAMDILSRATTPTMLSVLVAYYMLGLTNEEASEYAHVTPRQCQRLRREFTDMLS